MKLIDTKHVKVSIRKTTRKEFWSSLIVFGVLAMLIYLIVK